MPRDAAGGLPHEEAADRVPQERCARVRCISGAAVVSAVSSVAESGRDSMLDACFWCALYAVVPCARAVHGPTLEACRASGSPRSSLLSFAILTAWLSWAVPLQRRMCAARLRPVTVTIASPRVRRACRGARKLTLAIYTARPRFFLDFPTTFLRCVYGLQIICRRKLIPPVPVPNYAHECKFLTVTLRKG